MKKILLFCYLLPCFSFGQKETSDSFRKYSYQIYAFGNSSHVNDSVEFIHRYGGTGFFIQRKGDLFFITAKHVFTGCDLSSRKHSMPKTMNVWLPTIEKYIPINNSVIQDTAKCLPFDIDPDVIAIKISKEWMKYVNTLENYVCPFFDKVNAIQIFGYPKKESFIIGSDASRIYFTKNRYSIQAKVDSATKKVDSINYFISNEDVKFDARFEGYSGSPVFFQDRKSKNWRIGGVAVGWGDNPSGETFIIVTIIDFALNEIDKSY